MTRLFLINAGPTLWDEEDRAGGNAAVPLSEAGRAAIAKLAETLLADLDSIFCCAENEAANEAATIIARLHQLRVTDRDDLDELNIGLWQGLLRSEIRRRFPRSVEIWQKTPLAVEPPEGETIPAAIERLRGALRAIVKKKKGRVIAIVVRPAALQILAGLARLESPEQIAEHLHVRAATDTIELSDETVRKILTAKD